MQHRPVLSLTVTACLGALLLTGCAPEGTEVPETLQPGELVSVLPGTPHGGSSSAGGGRPDGGASAGDKQHGDVATDAPDELGEIEGRQPVETTKQKKLPSSFPSDAVALPADATVDDAGERADGSWFVVLRFGSLDEAVAALDEISENSSLSVTSTGESGGSSVEQTLEGEAVSIDALAFEDGDGALLSLDITATP